MRDYSCVSAGQDFGCEISREGGTSAGQNSGCKTSGEGGISTDRIPDVKHLEKVVECRPDRIPDVRHPEKVGLWGGQNSGCEISGEGMSAGKEFRM